MLTPAIQNKRATIENPSVPLSSYFEGMLGVSSSGANVSVENAPALSAVYASWKILGETLGSLSLGVFETKKNGDSVRAKSHPVDYILSVEPNPIYSKFTYIESKVTHLAARGNTFSYITRNGKGEVERIDLLDSASYKSVVDKGNIFYVNNKSDVFKGEEILHVPWMAFDGHTGKSPITIARETIGMGLKSLEYGSSLYANGAFLSGVLETDMKLSDEQYERVKAGWNASYGGAANGGKTAVLEYGVKFKPIRLSPEESRFIEAMRFTVEEVARLYRIPLHLLQSLDRSTNNNIEQQSIDFVMHTIRPYVKRFEAEFNRKLLTRKERERFKIRFNMDSLLRGDTEARANYYNSMWNIGALNSNEIRRLENMNGYDGGEDYYTPLNMSNKKDNNGEADL